jgi:sugar/nucleoside kinase (ribokinase family)
MSKRFDCVGFGLATLDHLSLVESFPRAGRKLEVLDSRLEGGGPVASALVTLTRLGLKTAFCGRLGNDQAGELVSRSFRDAKVALDCLHFDDKARTPTATVLVEVSSGKRTVLLDPGHGCNLRVREVDEALITSSQAIHLDGRDLAVNLRVARLARRRGVATFLDVGSLRNPVEKLLPLIDHLVVAEEYALGVSGKRSAARAIAALWQPTVKSFVVTLGAKGAIGYDGDSIYRQMAFEVPVRDVTGAGDAFHGGYIYGVLKGWSLPRVLRFSCAVAALNCCKLGGRVGLPSLAQVQRLLQRGEQQ